MFKDEIGVTLLNIDYPDGFNNVDEELDNALGCATRWQAECKGTGCEGAVAGLVDTAGLLRDHEITRKQARQAAARYLDAIRDALYPNYPSACKVSQQQQLQGAPNPLTNP